MHPWDSSKTWNSGRLRFAGARTERALMTRAVLSTKVQAEVVLSALKDAKRNILNGFVIAEDVAYKKVTIGPTSAESTLRRQLKLPTPVSEICPSGFYLKVSEVANHALFVEKENSFTENVLRHTRQNGFVCQTQWRFPSMALFEMRFCK